MKKKIKSIKLNHEQKLFLKNFLFVTLGTFLFAISIYMFTIPAKFAPGGVTGLAALIEVLTGFPAAYSLIFFNFPLLILAARHLSKKFTILTIWSILCNSLFLFLFSFFNFHKYVNPSQSLYAAMAGGLFTGIGIGLIINSEACSGGTDIIGLLIRKRNATFSISWLSFFMNVIVILLAGILYHFVAKMSIDQVITIVVASSLEVFISSRSMNLILNGINTAVKYEVITKNPEEVSQAIIKEISRGVTILESRGGYTSQKNYLVICVVRRLQIGKFKRVLRKTDPDAFLYGIATQEVIGVGFQKD